MICGEKTGQKKQDERERGKTETKSRNRAKSSLCPLRKTSPFRVILFKSKILNIIE